MTTAATHNEQSNTIAATLFVAFELGCVYFATTPSTLVFYSSIEPCLVSRFFLQKPVSGGHEPEASRRIWPGDCVDTLGFHGTSNTHRNRH